MSYTGMRGVFHRCRQTAPGTTFYLRIRFFRQIHLPCQMALCGTSQFPLQGWVFLCSVPQSTLACWRGILVTLCCIFCTSCDIWRLFQCTCHRITIVKWSLVRSSGLLLKLPSVLPMASSSFVKNCFSNLIAHLSCSLWTLWTFLSVTQLLISSSVTTPVTWTGLSETGYSDTCLIAGLLDAWSLQMWNDWTAGRTERLA